VTVVEAERKDSDAWYARSARTWRKAATIAATVALALLVANATETGASLARQAMRRLDVRARTVLDRGPRLDPRLKILAFDDKTAFRLASSELSPSQWAHLLRALGQAQVRLVAVDKIFAIPFAADAGLEELRSLGKESMPIVAGAYVAKGHLPGREPLPAGRTELDLAPLVAAGSELGGIDWLASRDEIPYGPDASVLPAFRHVGHLVFGDDGDIRPLIRIGADKGLRHLALVAADELRVDERGLWVDGAEARVDEHGMLPVDLGERTTYTRRTLSLGDVLAEAEAGAPIREVAPGDTVLILPAYFTGNTDFKDTIAGLMPGGFIVAAALNSVLTKRWLRPVGGDALFIVGGCALGLLVAALLSGLPLALAALALLALELATGLGSFAYWGLLVPWLLPIVGTGVTLVAVTLDRLRNEAATAQRLREQLGGTMPTGRIDAAVRDPRALQQPSEQVVSIMFIDIVGFSKSAELLTPKAAFSTLKDFMAEITAVVLEHGGIVDRSLGDGLMCIFGYGCDSAPGDRDHADRAVSCAMAIQRANVRRCLELGRTGQSFFPLRIGVNSAGAFIGDLGAQGKVDITAIGHGVNFAQRLEAACESHLVMLGPSSRDLLTGFSHTADSIRARLIAVKNRRHLFEAFQLDPHGDAAELQEVVSLYQRQQKVKRLDARWPGPPADRLRIDTEHGPGALVNFSQSGLGLQLGVFLASGVQLSLRLQPEDSELAAKLQAAGVQSLVAVVRWGRPDGDRYVHGLEVRNLSSEQREVLLAGLRHCTQKLAG
jgi:class 3 adenylate cyclase